MDILGVLINFLFDNYNKELLIYLLLVGFLTFLLYFYGNDKWKEFTDFDKQFKITGKYLY